MGMQGLDFSGAPVVSIAHSSTTGEENTTCEVLVTGAKATDINRLSDELRTYGFDVIEKWRNGDTSCLELSLGQGQRIIDGNAIDAIVTAANAVQMLTLQ